MCRLDIHGAFPVISVQVRWFWCMLVQIKTVLSEVTNIPLQTRSESLSCKETSSGSDSSSDRLRLLLFLLPMVMTPSAAKRAMSANASRIPPPPRPLSQQQPPPLCHIIMYMLIDSSRDELYIQDRTHFIVFSYIFSGPLNCGVEP